MTSVALNPEQIVVADLRRRCYGWWRTQVLMLGSFHDRESERRLHSFGDDFSGSRRSPHLLHFLFLS